MVKMSPFWPFGFPQIFHGNFAFLILFYISEHVNHTSKHVLSIFSCKKHLILMLKSFFLICRKPYGQNVPIKAICFSAEKKPFP